MNRIALAAAISLLVFALAAVALLVVSLPTMMSAWWGIPYYLASLLILAVLVLVRRWYRGRE